MAKEETETIIGPRGIRIPIASSWNLPSGPTWRRAGYSTEQREEARKIAEKKRPVVREYVVEPILRGLFDIASGGLGTKLGLFLKLAEGNLDDKACLKLCLKKNPGTSNFYSASVISNPGRGNKENDLVPEWFFETLTMSERFKTNFSRASKLSDKWRQLNQKDVKKEELMSLVYQDLYCMYGLANESIGFVNQEFPGIIRGHFRPRRYIHLRDQNWQQSDILSKLPERFNWKYKGQPTLEELLQASHDVLVEYQHVSGFDEEVEISPSVF